ncbi:hypothetical protein BH11ACT6_BH11ACT6_35070 [soil metagenome]
MNAAVAFVIGGGLTAVGGFIGMVINARTGLLKGNAEVKRSDADTAQVFEDLAESWTRRFDEKNRILERVVDGLVSVLDTFIEAVDRAAGRLDRVVECDEVHPITDELRDARRSAQQGMREAMRPPKLG